MNDDNNNTNFDYDKKIEDNITLMIKNLMNTQSSGEESMDESVNSEIENTNTDIISFDSSFHSEDNSKFILENLEKFEIKEIKSEKNFESMRLNEYNSILKLEKRNFSPLNSYGNENKSHNSSLLDDENINNSSDPKKSFFFPKKKKSNQSCDENLIFFPKNFERNDKNERNLSFSSQYSSQGSQDMFNFPHDQNFSHDFDLEKSLINFSNNNNTDNNNSSLFLRKIFKTQLANTVKKNKIYSHLLNNYNPKLSNLNLNKNSFLSINSGYKRDASLFLNGISNKRMSSSTLSLKK